MFKHTIAVLTIAVSTSILAAAEEKFTVNLSGLHLCCAACTKAINSSVEKLDGVNLKVQQKEGTASLTADGQEVAQKAIDAIAAAGFHGKLDSEDVAFKKVEIADDEVNELELEGIHNCCGMCNKAIDEAVKKVDGVTSHTAKPRETTMIVKGKFDPQKLIAAMQEAGFHCSPKEKAKKE